MSATMTPTKILTKSPGTLGSYIDSLELAAPELPAGLAVAAPAAVKDGEPSASIDAGSVFAFAPGVSGTHQSDVKNSMLLAQLAANYVYDREHQTEQWYGKYREVLENIGWVLTAFQFARYESSGQTFSMDKVVLDVLKAIASGDEMDVMNKAIDALGKLPGDDRAVVLFDNNGSSSEGGNFQAGTCSEDPNGNVQMSIGTFYFKTSEHHTRFLFWSWGTKSVNMYTGSQSIMLNEDVYSQVRQQIIDKLGDKAQQYVADLPI
jgi:hypothetical protein